MSDVRERFVGALVTAACGLLLALAGCGDDAGNGTGGGGGPRPTLPTVPGEPDLTVVTALPALPAILNVAGTVVGDTVDITFEPVEGARDYRVYELPPDGDVSADEDGAVTIQNALYRCAGDRETHRVSSDDEDTRQSEAIRTVVVGAVAGYERTADEATLGWVYVTPGEGRMPVWAMGNPAEGSDNPCYHQRWAQTRVKRYVTSPEERQTLLAERWRDDGVAFYVPEAAGPDTRSVRTEADDGGRLYFADGPEATERGGAEVAFEVLAAPPDGASAEIVPLMRVFYENACGAEHDELAAGVPRFERAYHQGDEQPNFALHWSGLTGPTTLVVEALDVGCPFQGQLAPVSSEGYSNGGVTWQTWYTLADLRAASETGEVYVNGQHDADNRPRPFARTFLKVEPAPTPELDWFLGFNADGTPGTFESENCGVPDGNCWQQFRRRSDYLDVQFLFTETDRQALAPLLGELWVGLADVGADVGGKFRMTATQPAEMSAGSYLYVTMQVDAYTTARRYPQILITDQPAPLDYTMEDGNTIIVETFSAAGTASWPYTYQVEVCDHQSWEVAEHCDTVRDLRYQPGSDDLAPNVEVGEVIGADRATHFEVYASTRRVYLFLNREPYGCVDLPSRGVPSGEVSVVFGDVLYHSGADSLFRYHEEHMEVEQLRHYDNLGFQSGVGAPAWDEGRLPCVADFE